MKGCVEQDRLDDSKNNIRNDRMVTFSDKVESEHYNLSSETLLEDIIEIDVLSMNLTFDDDSTDSLMMNDHDDPFLSETASVEVDVASSSPPQLTPYHWSSMEMACSPSAPSFHQFLECTEMNNVKNNNDDNYENHKEYLGFH